MSELGDPFQIAIMTGTGPVGVQLGPELRLAKAGLLYADRVIMMSPTATFLSSVAWSRERLDRGEPISAAFRFKEKREPISKMLRFLDIVEPLSERLVSDERDEMFTEAASSIEAQAGELDRAHDLGVLDWSSLNDPEFFHDAMGAMDQSDAVSRLMRRLSAVVTQSDSTYPMFDLNVADWLRIKPRRQRKSLSPRAAIEPQLAATFIGRLDTFPDATIDEILDVRRELTGPLIRFRSAIATMARQIEEVGTTPVDAEFGRIADTLYRETVEPALREIQELQRERNYGEQLSRQVLAGNWVPDSSTVAMAAAALVMLPSLGVATAGIALNAVVGGTKLALSIAREREALERLRRKNMFLFLPEAAERLRKRRA